MGRISEPIPEHLSDLDYEIVKTSSDGRVELAKDRLDKIATKPQPTQDFDYVDSDIDDADGETGALLPAKSSQDMSSNGN